MFVEYIIPNPMTLRSNKANNAITIAIPRSFRFEFLFILFFLHWQLVLYPIAACEQLFSLTVVTRVASGFWRVCGSTVAACRVNTACTVSTEARLEPTEVVTGNPIAVPLLYAEKISVF